MSSDDPSSKDRSNEIFIRLHELRVEIKNIQAGLDQADQDGRRRERKLLLEAVAFAAGFIFSPITAIGGFIISTAGGALFLDSIINDNAAYFRTQNTASRLRQLTDEVIRFEKELNKQP